MFGIDVKSIKGATVRPAPWGTEGDKLPCLVWEDPNPDANVKFCKVVSLKKVITAMTLRGLKGAANRYGLVCSDNVYAP